MALEKATFASGCFWCTEAIFKRLKGVREVISGYSGGKTSNPNYEIVSRGKSGHAEAITLTFDPKTISYQTLLEIFWKLHDPTTLNRQGADSGTQYRSIIFYHDENQKKLAQLTKEQLTKKGVYKSPIVTEIIPFVSFTKAEEYHQGYYDSNQTNPYCRIVIDPKIQKLYKSFGDVVKKN
ncbi:MAG: peptide-methionine (S)-S-oxide reductase MsrA [Candidatus Levybacteria bacterium]|nr:peptide-methionine (S)-S-oxide reductase MsrA [Candidatus Levybacteria bacterium]